jgi:hypothetical protein
MDHPIKFSQYAPAKNQPELHAGYEYGKLFYQEPSGPGYRLVLGASSNQIELLCTLLGDVDQSELYLLYVLHSPRLSGNRPGRYGSRAFASSGQVIEFLEPFKTFLESDGRHHLWIGVPRLDITLVYDHHNLIYCYGPIVYFKQILVDNGYAEGSFLVPAPHFHFFHTAFDQDEDRMIAAYDWVYSPLEPADEQ